MHVPVARVVTSVDDTAAVDRTLQCPRGATNNGCRKHACEAGNEKTRAEDGHATTSLSRRDPRVALSTAATSRWCTHNARCRAGAARTDRLRPPQLWHRSDG